MIVEYMKHLVNGELVNPEWIVTGDFFPNISNNTYVGIVDDRAERLYYVPNTLKIMDKASIQDRNLKIEFGDTTPTNERLTQAHEEAQTWWAENNIGE